eukprot:TRINITY_DN291_c0_g1_i2.p1 TRINITY_DN291_c0_g1~~TRINITY_DN291_c0_g1_i2.p1  ORF type:complete len:199 (+),score=73.42 TRINITY_DN291_c0_g1_i2:141-737(+)
MQQRILVLFCLLVSFLVLVSFSSEEEAKKENQSTPAKVEKDGEESESEDEDEDDEEEFKKEEKTTTAPKKVEQKKKQEVEEDEDEDDEEDEEEKKRLEFRKEPSKTRPKGLNDIVYCKACKKLAQSIGVMTLSEQQVRDFCYFNYWTQPIVDSCKHIVDNYALEISLISEKKLSAKEFVEELCFGSLEACKPEYRDEL